MGRTPQTTSIIIKLSPNKTRVIWGKGAGFLYLNDTINTITPQRKLGSFVYGF